MFSECRAEKYAGLHLKRLLFCPILTEMERVDEFE